MVGGAVRTGARVFERSGGSIAELARFVSARLPVIVGWWSRDPGDRHYNPIWTREERETNDCGHYSVICGVGDATVTMMDPQTIERDGHWCYVGRRTFRTREFLGVWYDTDTRRYKRVDRWYMVVHYDKRRFAPEISAGRDHG
jgi:hypothetical protein